MTYIPTRLREAVELHIYRNLAVRQFGSTPLILGIDGPPGEGKTFAASAIADSSEVKVFLVSGGQLENPHSGKPAEIIRDTYVAAGNAIRSHTAAGSVIVINDIDGGIGDWGPAVQYTVNRQHVITELMNLCDHPEQVEGRSTPRVPLIVTGNDFSKLYEPLIRSGRFRRFTWVPTRDEKIAVVGTLLPDNLKTNTPQLVDRYPGQPISFFADLVTFAKDQKIMTALRQKGFDSAVAATRAGSFPRINDALDIQWLQQTGDQLVQEHHNRSYVG